VKKEETSKACARLDLAMSITPLVPLSSLCVMPGGIHAHARPSAGILPMCMCCVCVCVCVCILTYGYIYTLCHIYIYNVMVVIYTHYDVIHSTGTCAQCPGRRPGCLGPRAYSRLSARRTTVYFRTRHQRTLKFNCTICTIDSRNQESALICGSEGMSVCVLRGVCVLVRAL
jgi:hypothetical protein